MPESSVVSDANGISGANKALRQDLSDTALGALSVPNEVRVTFEPKVSVNVSQAETYVRHATTTKSPELALQYWFTAHKSDPTNVTILDNLLLKAAEIAGVPSNAKSTLRSCQQALQADRHLANDYLVSLLKYSLAPLDGKLLVDAAAAAQELNLEMATLILGERAVKMLSKSEDKNRRNLFVKLAGLFQHFESYQNAVNAAKFAQTVDPKSGELTLLIKNLSSLEYLQRSRIQKNVEIEGGFVRNIQDPQEQRRLHEASQTLQGEDALFRQVEEARQKVSDAPSDVRLISELAKALIRRGKEGDQKEALKILREGFTSTQDWTLSFEADDLVFAGTERRLRQLENQIEEIPENEEIKRQHAELSEKLISRKIESYKARVAKQSNVTSKKFELGELYLEAKLYEKAIDTFQGILGDPKLGLQALAKVGYGFLKLGRYDEAVFAFEEALAKFAIDKMSPYNDDGREIFLEIHFGKSAALYGKAEATEDTLLAKDALKEIARVLVLDLDYAGGPELREKIKALLASKKTHSPS